LRGSTSDTAFPRKSNLNGSIGTHDFTLTWPLRPTPFRTLEPGDLLLVKLHAQFGLIVADSIFDQQ
jgi:hypothetical protein